jgi:protein-tyrosine kinase
VSLIERAIKRMDEIPAPVVRADVHPVEDDLDVAFADAGVAEAKRQRMHPVIHPVAQPAAQREPTMRVSVEQPAEAALADDDWSMPSRTLPLSDDFDTDRVVPAPRSKSVTIDLERLREGGMIAPDGDKTPLAEEFRVIKRPLLKNAFGGGPAIRNGNLVMVTSAFPREGKSFCAINLAMSIAMERDRTVLLVDADVARPSIPQKFGIAPDVGLMDVLLDSHVSLSDAIVRTNVNKLALLPAGRPHRQATELLASEAMAELLAELSARYSDRIVIFDSPPLLVTTEARALAANMGQIVMVVESENTTHEALREALATIESCEVVGMVLNKGRRSNPGDSYGYYGY